MATVLPQELERLLRFRAFGDAAKEEHSLAYTQGAW
jgi:hypothetical protein